MTDRFKKMQEYTEKYRFWTDKRITQLSFHNNLLLTIGISVIGYFWSNRGDIYSKLVIDINADINWTVFLFSLGMILCFVSIASGFMLSLSRLYDLRLTSNIALTRKRALDKFVNLENNNLVASNKLKSLLSLLEVIIKYEEKYHIRKPEIESSVKFVSKFTDVRQKADDLGTLTWVLVKWQTFSLFISIFIFSITLTIK